MAGYAGERNLKLQNFKDVYTRADIEAQVVESFPFDEFFTGQKETIVNVVEAFLNGGKPHVILEAPTGSGKTIIAWTVHRALDKLIGSERLKTTVSTTTKGLQKQYVEDCGTFNLMGKTNYPCPMGCKHYSTTECKHKVMRKECDPKSMCPYVKTRLNWTETMHWRSTNSAMLTEMCPMLCMEKSNRADLIVLDECHKMPDTLVDHTSVGFKPSELRAIDAFNGGPHIITKLANLITDKLCKKFAKDQVGEQVYFPADDQIMISSTVLTQHNIECLSAWCYDRRLFTSENNPDRGAFWLRIDVLIEYLNGCIEAFLKKIDMRLKNMENLDGAIKDACGRVILTCQHWADVCKIIFDCGVRDFILQEYEDDRITFKPIIAADVSQYGVFRKADYFLHMSATICGLDAYAAEMGLRPSQYTAIVAPHPIDVERRVINYVPQVAMGGGFKPEKAKEMASNIAELMTLHDGQNGLVHTASYKLAEAIISYMPSHLKTRCFVGREREKTLTQLRLNRGVVCFSPSMEEGYDLKHDLARWQVVAKVPYGYLGDPSIKYRADKVQGSYSRDAVLRIVQACGRVVRGQDDEGVTYILDKSFDRLLVQGDKFFPAWWLEALQGFD